MTKSRLSILMGAGASINAGLPSSNTLAEKFHEFLKAKCQDTFDESDRLLLDFFRFLDGSIRHQRGVLGQDPSWPVNIEQIAAAALRLKDRNSNPISPFVQTFHNRLDFLESRDPNLVDRFLEIMFARLVAELSEKYDDAVGVWSAESVQYLGHVVELSKRYICDCFSLNYDLCIERAVIDEGERLINGFLDGRWEPSEFDRNGGFRLFKLHGSLDWRQDLEHGVISVEHPRHEMATELELSQPLLIFGTDQKLTGIDPFLTLVYKFSRSLVAADILVTVGYSFSDGYINDMIWQAFGLNTRMKMIIVDPRAEIIMESHSTLRDSPRVFALPVGAEAALKDRKVVRLIDEIVREDEDDPFDR